jgi:hypothetical protein
MQKTQTLLFVSPLVLLAGLLPSSPQDGRLAPTPIRAQVHVQDQDDLLVLEAQEHSIAYLIDTSAKFLGRNYVYDRSQPRSSQEGSLSLAESQKVRLQSRLQLDRENCEDIIGQLVSVHDWTLSPLDPTNKIYQWTHPTISSYGNNRPRAILLTPEQILEHPNRMIRVTTTLRGRAEITSRFASDLPAIFGFSSITNSST